MHLTQKKCVPCEAGTPPLEYSRKSWIIKNEHLYKKFKFKNFLDAMKFVNSVAEIAEQEGHHPDFCIHYNKVEIGLWTHTINGLSENDFIVAAKIDKVLN